jgi:hypothetical protein
MNIEEILFWTPFGVLAFGTAMYVLISWRYWFGQDGRHHPAE